MKKSWIKDKLHFYSKNYFAYLICVVILSKLIGSPIPWVNMGIMLIALIVLLETVELSKNIFKRKSINAEAMLKDNKQ
ncbi:hypothetical protein MHB77_31345 [Paenibacillus sp. FSL K6-3166]|uniref:hypothetical protein n=1 Tax=Paenibacillus sp. FSL K6-3166 TaxID=2921492 RepID=UPI0030F5964C